jgi:hypothetical protein
MWAISSGDILVGIKEEGEEGTGHLVI